MARPRKDAEANLAISSNLQSWALDLGEALGRGVARGINEGISSVRGSALSGFVRGGRPSKMLVGTSTSANRCTVSGCTNPSRSKGLCSKHYQAARRLELQK